MNAANSAIEDAMREQDPTEDPCENPQSQRCKDWDSLQAVRQEQRREDAARRAAEGQTVDAFRMR